MPRERENTTDMEIKSRNEGVRERQIERGRVKQIPDAQSKRKTDEER